MAIPGIVGTAANGRNGAGAFTVTPPGGGVGYLAVAGWHGADADLTIPANWTQIARGTGADADWSRFGIWYSNTSPGSSWTAGAGMADCCVAVVGYDAAITVHQEAGTTSASDTAVDVNPAVTTTEAALIVRTYSGDIYDAGGGATITYPASHPDGQVQFFQPPGFSTDTFSVAICHVSQASPGSTGTAQYASSVNEYHAHIHTLALTSAGGGGGPDANQWSLPRQFAGPAPRLFRTGIRAPFQLQGDRTGPTQDTPVSLSDTAAGADALSVAAAVPLAETATALDSLAVAAALSLSDTAAASDALTVSVPITLTETATASDELTLAAAATLADTASAADALTIAVSLALADTASADETLTAGVPISLTDTASASDSLSVTAAAPLADTATAEDSLSVFAPGAVDAYQAGQQIAWMFLNPNLGSFQLRGDRASAGAGDQAISLSDTAAASDSLSVAAAAPLTDTATAADALTVTVALSLSETATASDAASTAAAVPLGDTAGALDELGVAGSSNPTLSDTATATDSLSITATVTLSDTATGSDLLTVTRDLALPETASATDALTLTAVVPLTETASALDALVVTAPITLADFATATDSLVVSLGVPIATPSRVSTGHASARASAGGSMFRVSTSNQMFRSSTEIE